MLYTEYFKGERKITKFLSIDKNKKIEKCKSGKCSKLVYANRKEEKFTKIVKEKVKKCAKLMEAKLEKEKCKSRRVDKRIKLVIQKWN